MFVRCKSEVLDGVQLAGANPVEFGSLRPLVTNFPQAESLRHAIEGSFRQRATRESLRTIMLATNFPQAESLLDMTVGSDLNADANKAQESFRMIVFALSLSRICCRLHARIVRMVGARGPRWPSRREGHKTDASRLSGERPRRR